MFYQIILRSVFWNKDICFYNAKNFLINYAWNTAYFRKCKSTLDFAKNYTTIGLLSY